jgi:hypothetical protein
MHKPSGFYIRKSIRESCDTEWLKKIALIMLLELEREKEATEKLFLAKSVQFDAPAGGSG